MPDVSVGETSAWATDRKCSAGDATYFGRNPRPDKHVCQRGACERLSYPRKNGAQSREELL